MFNMLTTLRNPLDALRLSMAISIGLIAPIVNATDLSNNLANATSGVETAFGTRVITAAFKTDASAHTLSSVTLLLANTIAGRAQVALYGDGNLEPGSLLANLTSPASYSATLANATFTASGAVNLAANTTYWIVLKPLSGSFDWAWTADNSGSGAGFLHTWGVSDDAGSFWWSHDNYQTKFSVVADVSLCAADITGDHTVNIDDLLAVINNWGGGAGNIADVNHDSIVNIDDLLAVINAWGACP